MVEPPVRVGQAVGGVLPGLVVGAGVGVAVGGALVGAGAAVRVGVGVAVGAALVGATVGVGEIRTVSGVQATAITEVSAKSATRRRVRRTICSTLSQRGSAVEFADKQPRKSYECRTKRVSGRHLR